MTVSLVMASLAWPDPQVSAGEGAPALEPAARPSRLCKSQG